jgi:formate-dependent nitrite reductase membrane component NrfD
MKDSGARKVVSDPDVDFFKRQRRLDQIRAEALDTGHVDGQGVRPIGAPIPRASVETGYYGIPMLKAPQWTWEIPVYFFVGGAAGAAAVIAQVAEMTGAEAKLVTDARTLAAIGSILTPALLIGDLGVPSRFLYMLRVFKIQSPMSVGVYIVTAFGPTTILAKVANWLRGRADGTFLRVIESASGLLSAIFGLGMATYTGVLIGATAIPVWNENIDSLPIHFALSGLGAGTSALQLMGHEDSRALNMLGIAASLGETLEGAKLELTPRAANEPLKKGSSGIITRLGGVLTGPVPLALRIAAVFAGERRAKQLIRVAAGCTIAGSFCTRVGWVKAGHKSALDFRLPLQIAPGEPDSRVPPSAEAVQKSINDTKFAREARRSLGRSDKPEPPGYGMLR